MKTPEPYIKQLKVRCIPGFWFIGIAVDFTTLCEDTKDDGGSTTPITYTGCSGKIGFLFFSVHFMFPVTKWKRRTEIL